MQKILAFLIASSALLPGCVRLPETDLVTNVPVHEVVRRLKCELVTAIDQKSRENPRFRFLTQWAAKVHLTLVVDDMSSINPGATLIEPLAVTGTSRSLAIGAGLTTEAVRTEDIEFFMSFPEVLHEMSSPLVWEKTYDFCRRDDGLLLESELGFKGLLDRALSPVAAGVLYTGVNNPGISGGQPPVPKDEISKIQTAMQSVNDIDRLPHGTLSETELSSTVAGRKVQELRSAIEGLKGLREQQTESNQKTKDEKTLSDNLVKAKQVEADTKVLISEVVTPLYDIANNSIANSCLKSVTKDKYTAVTSGSVVAIKKYGVDNAETPDASKQLLDDETNAAKAVYNSALSMLTTIKNCGPKEKAKPSLYDPLDIISETMNFYITANGSVTPMWKLVRVTAPLSTTFLSGQRKDTDTLILALGRPAAPGAGTLSTQPIDNQILARILSQAINSSVSH